MTLSEAPVGTRLRISRLHAQPDISKRLRELGMCEEAEVFCLTKAHGNIICAIRNTRIGLDHRLASTIVVSDSE